MGAWGEGIFDNDEALDFADEVIMTSNLSIIQEALDAVLDEATELEAPIASEGLAAADILARLNGHSGQTDAYTEKIDAWVRKSKQVPSEEILVKARAVVDRVRTEPSELLELWSEDNPALWIATLDALKKRLDTPRTASNTHEKSSVLERLRKIFRL